MDLKTSVIKAAIEEFDDKGIRFTMDDLSAKLRISKRTLYEQIGNKEDVIRLLVQEAFSSIREQERAILSDASLDIVKKIKRFLQVMPTFSAALDYRRVHELEKMYPLLFAEVTTHLQAGWESVLQLIEEGIRLNLIKPVDPLVLKEILLSIMDRMLKDRFLLEANMTYDEVLEATIEILFNGILL